MKDIVTEQVLSIVENYIDDMAYIPREDLTNYSYKKYMVEKLYSELLANDIPPLIAPLIVIEKFRDKMNKYASINPNTENIFLTGKEVAEYFIHLLI